MDKVSIIIPTKNRKKILEETVNAILSNQSFPLEFLEVIIVNDGDDDLSDISARAPETVKIIRNRKKGAGCARNSGAEFAGNELLLFLDDDMLISNDHIYKHLKIHEKYPDALASGSWIYDSEILENLSKTPFGRYKAFFDYKCISETSNDCIEGTWFSADLLASFDLSIRKKAFIGLGGFDERFPFAGCEDQEFSLRAKQSGMRLIIDKSNVALHNEKDRSNLKNWLNRQYTGVQGLILLAEQFPYRKKSSLYVENAPISKQDSYSIIAKKIIKKILSNKVAISVLEKGVDFFEKRKVSDKFLFKLYNALSGLYIYTGFSESYYKFYKKK